MATITQGIQALAEKLAQSSAFLQERIPPEKRVSADSICSLEAISLFYRRGAGKV